MGRRTILILKNRCVPRLAGHSTRTGGWSLIEVTISLFLLMAIALFGMKTMVSAFLLQNWSIAQSMTDAYAGIETAYAQRQVFGSLPDTIRWPIFPTSATSQVTIGQTPSQAVTATVIRTCYHFPVDPVTLADSYLLESFVVYQNAYQNGQRKYCKVSKVYRSK
jgi:hypothetical protein